MKTVTSIATQKRQNVRDPGSIQKAIFSLSYFPLINTYSTTHLCHCSRCGGQKGRREARAAAFGPCAPGREDRRLARSHGEPAWQASVGAREKPRARLTAQKGALPSKLPCDVTVTPAQLREEFETPATL